MYFDQNIFSYSNQSTYNMSSSPTISLELFNDTGEAVAISGADELFEIELALTVSSMIVVSWNTLVDVLV